MEGERQDAPVAVAANEKSIRGDKLRVFISYSRPAEAFAQELVTGLEIAGFQPYLDKHDIAAGVEWETRLGRLIEATDTVVFVISSDAVASERCGWVVKRTTELKTRAVPEADVPSCLKQLSYIFSISSTRSRRRLRRSQPSLRTDLDLIREHTRLGEAALLCEWDEQLQASGRARPPAGRFWYDRAVKLGSADAARRLPQLATAARCRR
jgi:hypothetical protein